MEDVPKRTVGSRRSATSAQAIKKGTRRPARPWAVRRPAVRPSAHAPLESEAARRPGPRTATLVVLAVGVRPGRLRSTRPAPSRMPRRPTADPPTLRTRPDRAATPEDPAVVYARIESQVQQIRGLTAKVTVRPGHPRRDGARRRAPDAVRQGQPGRRSSPAAQRVDRALGLIPADASLKELELAAAQRPGHRLLRSRHEADVCQVRERRARRDRADHVRPRVRPRPAGPALRPDQARHRRARPGRPLAGPALPRRGRRHDPHDRLGPDGADARPARSSTSRRPMSPDRPRPWPSSRPRSRRSSSSRTRAAVTFVQGLENKRRLGRGEPGLRRAARLDRADPPPREVRRPRGAGQGGRAGRPRDAGSAPAGRSSSRTRSGSSGCARGSRPSAGSIRSSRQARPTAGAATGSSSSRTATPSRWPSRRVWDTPADATAFAAAAETTRGQARRLDRPHRPGDDEQGDGLRRLRRRRDPAARGGARPGRLIALPRRGRRATSSRAPRSPSSPRVFASVIRVASARARRARERSGSAGSTTRASR